MTRKVRVRTLGNSEVREVTPEEAAQLLEKAANDPLGGLVMDAKTGQAVWKISPATEEIVIMEQMIGGG